MREKSLYVPVHAGLISHRKTRRLMSSLGISEGEAVGRLVMLWSATLQSNGNLAGWEPRDFAAAMLVEDADAWVDALIDAGFLDRAPDGSLSVHEWQAYLGKSVQLADAARERQRRYRERRAAQHQPEAQAAPPAEKPAPEPDDVIASFERALAERRSRKT